MGQVSDPSAKRTTNVYVLTENRLVRESLARMLQKRADLSVVKVSGFRDVNLDNLTECGCDVVLMDRLVPSQKADVLGRMLREIPGVKVVLFGMEEDSTIFLEAVRAGVCGYLLNDASASEIVAAVRAVCQGEAACSPKLCLALMQYVAENRSGDKTGNNQVPLKPSLTHRQLQLVNLVAKGMTNKEIAANLNLSEFTVKNHLRRIMKQTEAEDRHHVVRMVRSRGVELHS